MRTVGILVFGDVEVLDCCGPFEVFATTTNEARDPLFDVRMVSEQTKAIKAVGGLRLLPHNRIDNAPPLDVLVVPGGVGRKRATENHLLIDWIRERSLLAEITLSVCTGAFLLAKAGLLRDMEVTTHHSAHDELQDYDPSTRVNRQARFIAGERIVTAAGISAGIDASLYIVSRLYGENTALRTARRMEYPWPQPHSASGPESG